MKMIVCDEEREVNKCQVVVKKSYGKLCYVIQVRCKTEQFGIYEWNPVDFYLDPEKALFVESKINDAILLEESQPTLKVFSLNNLLSELDQEVDNEK